MVDLDLRRLRLLRELQERGTFAAVAQATGYSPSAISQQFAVLEKEVGVAVVRPAGRCVRLTPAGELLARHAVTLLEGAAAAMADLSELAGEVRGTVRAGGLQSAMRRLLIPTLADLAVHPHLRVELQEIELEQALPELRLGSLDLVVSDEYAGHPRPRPTGLRIDTLVEEPMQLVLPRGHRLAEGAGPLALTELRDDVWVASAPGTGHTAMVLGTCRSLGGFDPDVRHHSSDVRTQLQLVRTAGAVAMLSRLALPPDDPEIVLRPVAGGQVGRRLFLVTRQGPASQALGTVLRALRARAAEVQV